MKQTTFATARKGRVDERKKDWTRKPKNPKKRNSASVRSFLRSVHLARTRPHLPKLLTILAEISQFKGRNSERSKKREKEKQSEESEREKGVV